MSEVVLDASALLALLNAEKGADLVQEVLTQSIISTVNLSEGIACLSLLNMPENQIREVLGLLALNAIPFDEEQAYQAGLLSTLTHPNGLSLGDRACLALAMTKSIPVITADRAWHDLDLGIPIKVIR